jgi:hypothetical protein
MHHIYKEGQRAIHTSCFTMIRSHGLALNVVMTIISPVFTPIFILCVLIQLWWYINVKIIYYKGKIHEWLCSLSETDKKGWRWGEVVSSEVAKVSGTCHEKLINTTFMDIFEFYSLKQTQWYIYCKIWKKRNMCARCQRQWAQRGRRWERIAARRLWESRGGGWGCSHATWQARCLGGKGFHMP